MKPFEERNSRNNMHTPDWMRNIDWLAGVRKSTHLRSALNRQGSWFRERKAIEGVLSVGYIRLYDKKESHNNGEGRHTVRCPRKIEIQVMRMKKGIKTARNKWNNVMIKWGNCSDLKLSEVSWLTTGRPVAAASASLRPASSIWKGRSVALDTTCTRGKQGT